MSDQQRLEVEQPAVPGEVKRRIVLEPVDDDSGEVHVIFEEWESHFNEWDERERATVPAQPLVAFFSRTKP